MTFKEFELHRPKLARSLADFAGEGRTVEDIEPEYENEELFTAMVIDQDGIHAELAVCVKATHPMAMREEEAPGVPTWWWQSDLTP